MKKTVITPVGVSLLENILLKRTQLPLSFGLPSIREVEDLNQRCEYGSLTPQEAASLEDPEVRRIAERFEGAFSTLWASQARRYTINGGQRKREYSPAELASLSLLDLKPGDRVVLLYSETPKGGYCAAVLQRLLEAGIAVPGGLKVEKQLIKGLQLENLKRFTNQGVVSYTRAVRGVVDDQEGTASVVLNITGGYKGVAPIATIVAMALGVDVCYLYEESDELLFLPALDVTFGFSRLFQTYRPIMQLITPPEDPLPSAAEEEVWDFVTDDDRQKLEKYLATDEGRVQLSPLGVLAWTLHKCRPKLRQASRHGPLTQD